MGGVILSNVAAAIVVSCRGDFAKFLAANCGILRWYDRFDHALRIVSADRRRGRDDIIAYAREQD